MNIGGRVRSLATRALHPRGESPGLRETVSLIERYVVQETLGPLRSLGRTLALGLAGALLASVGAVFALVGVLRLLETETGTAFSNSWSFAPYLLTAVVGVALLGSLALVGLRALHAPQGEA